MEEMGAATGMIFLCLDDTQKINVEDYCRCDNPVGMWTSLKALHHQKTTTTHFTAYDMFFSVRKDPDESLSALHTRVIKIMADICLLRLFNFNLSKLDEEFQIIALICALLMPEYTAFVDSIFLNVEKLTLTGLHDLFHMQE
ncbi:hypothetical protein ARMGADRAFT_1128261, partial [Armillaria gallica]